MATKWGILSTSEISHDVTVCLRTLGPEKHQVVAVASRKLEDASEFAAKHNIPKAYGSYEELVHDSDVEIVFIGTCVSDHYSLGQLMLKGGKHVLMAMPFTYTAKEAQDLINLAQSKGLFLMESIWPRFNPCYTAYAANRIKKFGNAYSVISTLGNNLIHKEELTKKSTGGGTVLNLGSYNLNLIQMAYNNEEPEEIKAIGHLNEDGVDESITCSLKYSKGRTAIMSCTLRAQMPNEAFIIGNIGRVKIDAPFWCSGSGEAYYAKRGVWLHDCGWTTIPPATDPECYLINGGYLCYVVDHVRDCLVKELTESPIIPLKDTLLIRKISDEIFNQIGVNWN